MTEDSYNQECSICLEYITNDDITLNCRHRYHYTCLRNNISNKCPTCRKPYGINDPLPVQPIISCVDVSHKIIIFLITAVNAECVIELILDYKKIYEYWYLVSFYSIVSLFIKIYISNKYNNTRFEGISITIILQLIFIFIIFVLYLLKLIEMEQLQMKKENIINCLRITNTYNISNVICTNITRVCHTILSKTPEAFMDRKFICV